MKLAKVVHYRCDEYSNTSYVWVPDDMTLEQFHEVLDKAEEAYLAFIKEWNATEKVQYVNYTPDYKKYPKHLTIAEIDTQHAEALAKYKEFEQKELKSKRKFSHFLADQGLKQIWDYEPELTSTIDWGHNHGMGLDYVEKLPKDFPNDEDDEDDEDDD